MMNMIAIDPGYGKRSGGCACALFVQGTLEFTWFVRPSDVAPLERDIALVVVEQPQQDARSWGVPPATLIRLSWDGALVAGLYAGLHGADVKAVTPSQWKGSVPKPVQHGKVWPLLSDSERELLGGLATGLAIEHATEQGARERWRRRGGEYYPSAFRMHNLLDAVAIGLVEVGRFRLQKYGPA